MRIPEIVRGLKVALRPAIIVYHHGVIRIAVGILHNVRTRQGIEFHNTVATMNSDEDNVVFAFNHLIVHAVF